MNQDLPLVLLHGWGMTTRIWNGLRICLSPRIALTPALPGHDEPQQSGQTSPGASLQDWSEAVLAKLPPRCVLAGWSLGAMLALDLAARHPERIQQLVLFGTTPRFVAGPDWPHGLDAPTVAAFSSGFATDPEATLRRFMALQLLGESRRRGVMHSLGNALLLCDEGNTPALADGLHILAQADLRASVANIEQPVSLIHGRDDALMPLAAAQWLAQALPDARLTVLDGCGHVPFVSQAEECARLLEAAFA